MTVSEFKAWLEGLGEAMGGKPPSADQWKLIQSKLSKVSERPTVALSEPRATWMSGPVLGH